MNEVPRYLLRLLGLAPCLRNASTNGTIRRHFCFRTIYLWRSAMTKLGILGATALSLTLAVTAPAFGQMGRGGGSHGGGGSIGAAHVGGGGGGGGFAGGAGASVRGGGGFAGGAGASVRGGGAMVGTQAGVGAGPGRSFSGGNWSGGQVSTGRSFSGGNWAGTRA